MAYSMTIYPAIDIKGGRCVRLTQGRADQETVYADNPADVAAQFKAMADTFGATRIAIVPTSGQFDTHKHILADFVDQIRPMLDED